MRRGINLERLWVDVMTETNIVSGDWYGRQAVPSQIYADFIIESVVL